MNSILDTIKSWLRRAEEIDEGSVRDPDREGSTNAQVEGAADEPWSEDNE